MQPKAVLLFLLLLVTGLGACNKLLEVPAPPNEIAIGDAFNDSSSALSAIAGIYNEMASHTDFEWCGLSFYTSRSADDVAGTDPFDQFAADSLSYINYDLGAVWTEGFHSLFTINICLSGLQSSKGLSAGLHRQLQGEALFCRAFVYFYLVNLWGDAVPLLTTPDVDLNQAAGSVPRQKIYDQMIADLLQAQGLLTSAYAGAGRVRPNLMAVNALLARIYLYQGRMADAINQSGSVIGSNLYTPLPAPADAFLKSSREAIWQLLPSTGASMYGAVGDAGLYQSSDIHLTPQLVGAFDSGDLRRQAWVTEKSYTGATYTTASKYKDKGFYGYTAPSEYYIVLRLAEQYLIRAEANARLGNVGAAIADINVIRARAGLADLPSSLTAAQCLSALEHERRVELFTEWGHRWLDLRRWPGVGGSAVTRADEVLGGVKPDWQPTDTWYPVPRAELQLNSFLIQNSGYPGR